MYVGRLLDYQSIAPYGSMNGVRRQMGWRVSSPLVRVSSEEPVERFQFQS